MVLEDGQCRVFMARWWPYDCSYAVHNVLVCVHACVCVCVRACACVCLNLGMCVLICAQMTTDEGGGGSKAIMDID